MNYICARTTRQGQGLKFQEASAFEKDITITPAPGEIYPFTIWSSRPCPAMPFLSIVKYCVRFESMIFPFVLLYAHLFCVLFCAGQFDTFQPFLFFLYLSSHILLSPFYAQASSSSLRPATLLYSTAAVLTPPFPAPTYFDSSYSSCLTASSRKFVYVFLANVLSEFVVAAALILAHLKLLAPFWRSFEKLQVLLFKNRIGVCVFFACMCL